MLVTVLVTGVIAAVLARRVGWVRDRLPPPASTLLTATAAAVVVLTLMSMSAGPLRIVLAAVGMIVVSAALIAVAGIAVERVLRPARQRRAAGPAKPTFRAKLVNRAEQTRWRVGRWNVAALGL